MAKGRVVPLNFDVSLILTSKSEAEKEVICLESVDFRQLD